MTTAQRPAPESAPPARLTIGDVAALTGITPGRIRHYEARGLVSLAHAPSGYRFFRAADVLRLLHIDLLRSLGFGL
ncbi:MAG TPA: MerR family transcriptional regulator, partial [Candidatus Dormibacteraeota bacterium]|nr:MerR family transcriptional regulator [Candidatus Dormibacteraeota bacterium]